MEKFRYATCKDCKTQWNISVKESLPRYGYVFPTCELRNKIRARIGTA